MRITRKDLEATVARINRTTKSPLVSWEKAQNGTHVANIGNYHLSGAYGGVALHRIVSDGGAVEDVFRSGHITKRDLYERMHAYLRGIETCAS